MTHHPVVVLPDGTRRYSNYSKYTPKPLEERTYKVRKPDHPQAVRFHGQWFIPLELLSDEYRTMPETRPDTDAYDHMVKPRKCRCVPCQRPEARAWQQRWRDDQLKS